MTPVEIDGDPPLTRNGIDQAQKTGEYLKEVLSQRGFTKFVIYSSPFLRCLQTASEVATVLEVRDINLDFLISEVQTNGIFK